jgi:hypothetical protein
MDLALFDKASRNMLHQVVQKLREKHNGDYDKFTDEEVARKATLHALCLMDLMLDEEETEIISVSDLAENTLMSVLTELSLADERT